MDIDRLNTPDTCAYAFEIMGNELQFIQDPNSKHHGTTVWDASLVFAKFMEKNCRKGRFCSSKLKGKRVIELGAGCGVAGFGMALLGCDVLSTDQAEVLPLLTRNVERNMSSIMQMNPNSDSFGSIQVAELGWGNEDHIKAAGAPFDFIIGTDIVYSEHLLEPLLQTMLTLSGPRTTIILGYEVRSTNVHEQMLDMWKRNFDVKIVSKSKMDSKYQHPSIQLFIMTLKPLETGTGNTSRGFNQETEVATVKTDDPEKGEGCGINSDLEQVDDVGLDEVEDNSLQGASCHNEKLDEWEARRQGAMAARLLRNVKLT